MHVTHLISITSGASIQNWNTTDAPRIWVSRFFFNRRSCQLPNHHHLQFHLFFDLSHIYRGLAASPMTDIVNSPFMQLSTARSPCRTWSACCSSTVFFGVLPGRCHRSIHIYISANSHAGAASDFRDGFPVAFDAVFRIAVSYGCLFSLSHLAD